ncbi:hypothetical protein [Mumia zhuanghuii]|uniref:hypothetical protein n=1 Tax=Mumia zhuanghuii TaxID=2585211 RepID=UPI00129C7D0F|nr:hypothetical protein [Mumia zhuanghuii]
MPERHLASKPFFMQLKFSGRPVQFEPDMPAFRERFLRPHGFLPSPSVAYRQ